MSVSKAWTQNENNQEEVLARYRSTDIQTVAQIASAMGTTESNVRAVLRSRLAPEEFRALKSIHYSASKVGAKNPMWQKTGAAHHNWIGECEDGRGYLTCLWNGKREFVHRVVMMEALGLTALPDTLVVHHIDGNPKNNTLDNLALLTHVGHVQVHALQLKDSMMWASRRSTLAEALRYMTSPSKTTKAM